MVIVTFLVYLKKEKKEKSTVSKVLDHNSFCLVLFGMPLAEDNDQLEKAPATVWYSWAYLDKITNYISLKVKGDRSPMEVTPVKKICQRESQLCGKPWIR